MGARSASQGHRSGLHKGAWTPQEDALLRNCMEKYGAVKWSLLPERAGLNRCPKSCRLRWLNYLCPSIKRGKFDDDEVDLIIRLHKLLGNRWSLIAGRLPGRTANDVKNYWNTHAGKQLPVEKEKKEAISRYVEVVRPQPQTIHRNWKWSGDIVGASPPGKHHQEECDAAKQPSSSNNNSIVNTETVNFAMASVEVGMTQGMQAKCGFEDIGSFGDDDFLLQGFGELGESFWKYFESI